MKHYIFLLLCLGFFACDNETPTPETPQETGAENLVIEHSNISISINKEMKMMVNNKAISSNPLMNNHQETEFIATRNGAIADFILANQEEKKVQLNGGNCTIYTLTGSNSDGIQKTIQLKSYEQFPDFISMEVEYTNKGDKIFDIERWVNHHYTLTPNEGTIPPFWSFQGSSNSFREDWIQAIDSSYYKKNYMGMNNSDYGGGIPVIDLWRKDGGIAIGHTALVPKLVSLPVEKDRYGQEANIHIEYEYPEGLEFKPDDVIQTIETFVSVHTGDCFASLRRFSEFMQAKGLEFASSPASAFEPMWCAWGYERNFTLDEIIGTLPKVKELGIKWATLDDGYQITEGDWTTNSDKFPNGDVDMKNLTKAIHDAGLKAQIWWAPLAVSPDSRLLQEHPGVLLRTKEWTPQFITWWDAWYMSPTSEATLNHTKEVVTMFIKDWDFDGLKMDGQHLNGVLPDHGQGLDNPNEACEQLPQFFQTIYNTATDIKADALLQHCPCGTCMSFYNMPATNQTVSSDPLSSLQIRQKGKVYKAIIPNVAYFGDHVELSDNGNDFASSFGIGAVLGTKFTWPKDNPDVVGDGYLLTPEKEAVWRKWFSLYNDKMLSKEPYLGDLYDIGYDKPEAHVIKKGSTFYYAFYANNWDGDIQLKGLDANKKYTVRDYFNDQPMGVIDGENAVLNCNFDGALLLEVGQE